MQDNDSQSGQPKGKDDSWEEGPLYRRPDPVAAEAPQPEAPRADPLAPRSPVPARDRPGEMLARGVCRHMRAHDFVTVEEFVPARGLRVDVMGLGPRDEIWVIECKSCRADFTGDRKWQGYLEWCDRYFWAVDRDFPAELLPEGTGLLLADGYDAEILRMGEERRLPAARRKVLMRKFARHAALRLQGLRDPGMLSAYRP